MPVPRIRTLPLVLAMTIVACDPTTAPPVGLPPGTAQIQVSGDTSFTVDVSAAYGQPQMTLTDREGPQDAEYVQLFVAVAADPRERRYDGMAGGSTFVIVRGGQIARQFASTAGWVELYEVTPGNIQGWGEMTAEERDLANQPIPGRRVTISTVFNASRP